MSSARAWTAGLLCAVPLIAALAAGPAAALERTAAAEVALRAGPAGARSFVRPETGTDLRSERASTFQVTYTGFPAAARAAFQRAVDVWTRKLASPVPITVSATYQPLGPGVLGSAGPGNLFSDFPGAPVPDTEYVDALANKLAGRQIDPSPDIVTRFSSVFPNWHFGSGPAPAGKYDFTTVVLHELGHGLGFYGAGRVSGSAGTVRRGGRPIAYDLYTENGAGRSLLEEFPDNSSALAAQLQSNNLFFDSPRVRAANNNRPARLYAPSSFQGGSSYSHLDEATYRRGDANSLMTPQLGQGESIRKPGPITLAIFRTLGW